MIVSPTKDHVLVRRIDGHGKETITSFGIIIPRTAEKTIQTKRDHFRATVLAMGPEAFRKTRLYRGDPDCSDCLGMTHCEFHHKAECTYPSDRPQDHGTLSIGDDVLVYTYANEEDKIYTGERTQYGRFVRLDDILCVVDG